MADILSPLRLVSELISWKMSQNIISQKVHLNWICWPHKNWCLSLFVLKIFIGMIISKIFHKLSIHVTTIRWICKIMAVIISIFFSLLHWCFIAEEMCLCIMNPKYASMSCFTCFYSFLNGCQIFMSSVIIFMTAIFS